MNWSKITQASVLQTEQETLSLFQTLINDKFQQLPTSDSKLLSQSKLLIYS